MTDQPKIEHKWVGGELWVQSIDTTWLKWVDIVALVESSTGSMVMHSGHPDGPPIINTVGPEAILNHVARLYEEREWLFIGQLPPEPKEEEPEPHPLPPIPVAAIEDGGDDWKFRFRSQMQDVYVWGPKAGVHVLSAGPTWKVQFYKGDEWARLHAEGHAPLDIAEALRKVGYTP